LLGDGVPPENLYPLDVDRALGKLDTIREQILWWETGAQLQQQLADGEVALSSAWNGRVQKEIDAGTPVKSVDTSEMFHKEGGTDDVPLSKEECVRRVTLLVKVLTT
jgi:spermidine/putrescine-binding protein